MVFADHFKFLRPASRYEVVDWFSYRSKKHKIRIKKIDLFGNLATLKRAIKLIKYRTNEKNNATESFGGLFKNFLNRYYQ